MNQKEMDKDTNELQYGQIMDHSNTLPLSMSTYIF